MAAFGLRFDVLEPVKVLRLSTTPLELIVEKLSGKAHVYALC
jgi:hypothetical protein